MKTFSDKRRELLAKMLQERGLAPDTPATATPAPAGPPPCSLNQEGLWFLEQLVPGQARYNIPGAVRLDGALDVAALEQSLNFILARHEALRTTFSAGADGRPRPVIHPAAPLPLPLTDLSGLPAADREAAAARLAAEDARRPFDLSTGPLLRAFLLRLAPTTHVLVLNVHHIAADGWSMGIFTRELNEGYAAFSRGATPAPPPLPAGYGDFARWQRDHLQGATLDRHLAFWRAALAGAPEKLSLPLDFARPAAQSFQGGHQPLQLTPELTGAVRALARQENVTPFAVLSAAWRAVLAWHSGQYDIVLGTTFANRDRPEWAPLIGFFVNTLPLRTRLNPAMTFRDLLRGVSDATLAAHEHQDLPLSQLVKHLKIERNLSYNPLFQVVFDLLTPDRNPAVYGYGLATTIETLALDDLTMQPLPVAGSAARFDITVILWDMPAAVAGVVEYDAALFTPARIDRLSADFRQLLRAGTQAPQKTIETLLAQLAPPTNSPPTAGRQAILQHKLRQSRRRPIGPRERGMNE